MFLSGVPGNLLIAVQDFRPSSKAPGISCSIMIQSCRAYLIDISSLFPELTTLVDLHPLRGKKKNF